MIRLVPIPAFLNYLFMGTFGLIIVYILVQSFRK